MTGSQASTQDIVEIVRNPGGRARCHYRLWSGARPTKSVYRFNGSPSSLENREARQSSIIKAGACQSHTVRGTDTSGRSGWKKRSHHALAVLSREGKNGATKSVHFEMHLRTQWWPRCHGARCEKLRI
ncbi:hypothetical protein KM043_002413 [Ampulex compressa]|nr:hypothetical protein KM043_002413 [Ampulex compressa]